MHDNKQTKYVYGINPIREKIKIIKSGVLFINKNYKNSRINDLITKAKSKNLQISFIDNDSFYKFFGEQQQGVVLKIEEDFIEQITENEFYSVINKKNDCNSLIVILDGIKDVGNFGAVLRSCLLFDVEYVVLPKDNSASITDTVIKRSAGAAFHNNIIYVTNIVRTIEKLKDSGYWIYAADNNGDNIKSTQFHHKTALVFGEEGKGIRPLVKKNCDIVVTIPTNNKLDSLNLAVSVGIFLFEINKKIK